MELNAIFRCVAALDVHQAKLTVCILFETDTGEIVCLVREFGGFKRDRREMAAWVSSFKPELVVMESTGIYWKSPYAALEWHGLKLAVVNAYPVKQVPGRKTDIADAQWLAILARSGLLRGGFVPPQHFREYRLISRQLQKLTSLAAGEKNRLHKLLTDAGIRLSVVVSDLYGKSAKAMIKGLLDGETPEQLLAHADSRLKASPEELLDALDGDLSESHRFVIRELSAAMLFVEIGDDMSAFGAPAKLASWAGVCPGQNESAGKRKSAKTRKGNPYLRRILCEVANAASRTRCSLQSLMIRRGRKRAIFAIAHKLLKTVFLLIQRGDYYRDANTDYEALSVQRNAPR